MPVQSPQTSLKCNAPPSARTAAYYMDWIGELHDFHKAGMIEDEAFAYQRAERLEELLDLPRRKWLGWIRVGVPIAGLAGVAAWWATQDILMLLGAGVIVVLCVFATIGRLSRERKNHLTIRERSDIVYDLLQSELISSEEFLAFDERLTGRTTRE